MTDPQRLLQSKQGISALERRVLDSAARIAAPPGAKDQIWSLLAPQVGAATGAASLAAKSAFTTAIVKAVAIGALVGGTITGGAVWIARSPSPSEPPARPASVSAPHPLATSTRLRERPAAAPTPVPSALEPSQENPAKARPAVAPAPAFESAAPPLEPMPNPDESASRAAFPDATGTDSSLSLPAPLPSSLMDRARLESQRVAEARGLLRAGAPGAALSLLERVAREFPNGVLAQEREALSVEALLASGQREQARARARAFLENYANSPHSAAVRRALE